MANEKPKGLKPLTPDTKEAYDEIINRIRVELGIPMNRTILNKIAVADFIAKRTSASGKVDLLAVSSPYAKVKLNAEANALEKKLAEKKKALDAMKG